MTSQGNGNGRSYVYVGLAGETAPGREIQSGLYRMAEDDQVWQSPAQGLPEAPAIRAIAVHPQKPEIVYVGTQEGPYRSNDHGEHFEKVNVPDHGLPVWSILFHPRDPDVIFAGYESNEIYRSENGGESWRPLPVNVQFPDVTTGPRSNPAKRVLMMSASASDPDQLYGAIEVGGIIRTLDGGGHWENLSHGMYVNDDAVDMHGVLVSSLHSDTVFGIARAGLFRSTDQGCHWSYVTLGPLNDKGQTYCRHICEVPGDPNAIWVAAGPAFRSDRGVLFYSGDGGMTWDEVDMGLQPGSTMFSIAIDQGRPARMYCTTTGGEVFGSQDGGQSWNSHVLPEGASQVYALACG